MDKLLLLSYAFPTRKLLLNPPILLLQLPSPPLVTLVDLSCRVLGVPKRPSHSFHDSYCLVDWDLLAVCLLWTGWWGCWWGCCGVVCELGVEESVIVDGLDGVVDFWLFVGDLMVMARFRIGVWLFRWIWDIGAGV
jgi:hypothetical protein